MTNIIKQNQQSEWLDVIKGEVQFFLHQPSGKCGIHVRGLASMCGVKDRAIRYLLDLRNNSDFFESRYLKNKEIYLTDLRKNHPIKNGKPVKVVEASVCAEVIHYYANEQNRAKAIKSALAFMRFGLEQYIYAQVGYIPTPVSMLIDEIEFLFAEEPVQVTKSQTKSVECGIELQGVDSLCGGVALKQVKQFLDQTDAPFLLQNQQRVIVKAAACTASFDYFANHSKPRKSLAKLSLVNLDPIVPKIHAKTRYQNPHTEREVILQAENEQLKKEVEHLRQLTQ